MQMYDIVATGVLGLLVGFWSGRSIRWKMEETEETGEDREERKNTAARQLVREGVTIGSPVNGEIRKRMEETSEETADAGTGCISIVPEDGKVYQEGLAREGVDTAVTVEMCQIPERGQIVGTWKDYIRAGEELLWIQRKGRNQEDSFCLR